MTHRDGPLLVVAGAGSGKTRTLIYRVARLIESGVPPGAILLLTFTRRASQEMLRRVEQLVGDRAGAVAGGTFHSFANLVLRRFGAPIGLKPNFTILDRSDMEDVVNLLRTRMGLASRERRFPKKGTIAEAISMARNKRRALEEEIELDFPHLIEHSAEILELAENYETYKRERGLLDYDDLLYRLAELLQQHEPTPPAPVGHLSLHHDRRVPGHQPDPGGAGAAARDDPSQRDGGGRRRAVDLFVSRRQFPQHHGLSRKFFRARTSSSWKRITARCRASSTSPTK